MWTSFSQLICNKGWNGRLYGLDDKLSFLLGPRIFFFFLSSNSRTTVSFSRTVVWLGDYVIMMRLYIGMISNFEL